MREAEKFSISAQVVSARGEGAIDISNYQKLDHFDLSGFGGVALDESSILKNVDGHYRTKLVTECHRVPFRLAATATRAGPTSDPMPVGSAPLRPTWHASSPSEATPHARFTPPSNLACSLTL